MTRAVRHSLLLAGLIAVGPLAACGGESDADPAATLEADAVVEADAGADADGAAGVVSVAPTEAAAVIDAAPDDLVVLDVRTPEEYAEGHLDGAVMLDFYEPDFVDQLAALDRNVPYVLYCRSGNRSGQVLPIMDELGFRSVTEVAGGIVAWQAEGLPVTTVSR